MNRMQAWSGMFAVSPHEGLVSPDYSVFGPIDASDVKYFEHLFKTPVLVDQFAQRSKGIGSGFNRLYTPDFGSVPIVVPPLPEQAVIARFLDYMDRRIRKYIRAKQQLIKLLEEQKQAIIHRTVTRGLDPNVRLKPSGVEWLGDVPEYWEVARLKRVSLIQGGYAFPADSFGDAGIPVVRMNNIRRGTLDFNQVVRIPEHQCKEAFVLKEGDIVYGLSGSIGAAGSLGNYAVVKSGDLPAQLNQRVARFQPNKNRIAEGFLLESLQTNEFYEQVLAHTTGTAQFNVSTNDIGNVALALPSLDEQKQIVNHLKSATESIVTAVDRARQEIVLLREYRTRLIADVVTGKLDVCEAAAPSASPGDSRGGSGWIGCRPPRTSPEKQSGENGPEKGQKRIDFKKKEGLSYIRAPVLSPSPQEGYLLHHLKSKGDLHV